MLDLGLNLLAEAIGIAITIFLVARIIRTREKRRIAPVRDALLDRIDRHCRLLSTLVQNIALQKGEVSTVLIDYIKRSKANLLESVGLGEEIISPDIKEALLGLDGKIEILLNASTIKEYYPEEMWTKNVDETLSNVKTIFDLLGKEDDSMLLEAWQDVFREKPHLRTESTKMKKAKRKNKRA